MDTLHLYVLLVELDMRLSLSQETPPSVSTSCWLIFGRFMIERRKRRKREDYLTKRVSAPSSLNYEMYMRTDVNQKLIGSGSQKLVIFISLINLQNIIRFWELQGFTFFNFWFPKPHNIKIEYIPLHLIKL